MNNNIRVVYVEKKENFDVEGKELLKDFKESLLIKELEEVRVVNRYIVKGISEEVYEKALFTVFSEKTQDVVYEKLDLGSNYIAFGVEYLPGQYDQRADAAEECIEILTQGEKAEVKCSKIIALKGSLKEHQVDKIKNYYINPVDSREASLNNLSIENVFETPKSIERVLGFITMEEEELINLHSKLGLAMTLEDLKLCQSYFKEEKRNPSCTEIAVIDTYWSDHCRHTTFSTTIKDVNIEENLYSRPIKKAYDKYISLRSLIYKEPRDITLMDIATIAMKEMRKRGLLEDLDLSDEINACTIKADIETTEGIKEYLILFKNETHNHPTEIEPFGGAATCLGGAIRDPLSGRAYVYQAMRVTGSGDPREDVESTLKGKLPQRKITLGAAKGYSSYGNQIGLATGQVAEIYDEGFKAKRMEIGAVIGAVPKENVVREKPALGDVVILLGGRTGRDGCGGATGSSKEHTEESINLCGAEVQKGNAPTERKIQRFFRNPEISRLIKKCNDFGAGGVAVAVGELCDGLDINLDLVPKKYEGLDGTELAISESQERMAVVTKNSEAEKFINLALEENLEATIIAQVTDNNRLRMLWREEAIVDINRDFLNTNGAKSYAEAFIKAPSKENNYFLKAKAKYSEDLKDNIRLMLSDLNISSQKGLVERFDSTIGSGTVLMPFGGKYQLTPAEGMAAKIPVLQGETDHCSLMSYGYNPNIAKWSPFHGALYAVIESVCKIVAMGGDYTSIRLTFQEYFEKLGKHKEKWGKPFAALLGALWAQEELSIAAIGGKDSMSGTFEEITVPPTLVSFALALDKSENIVSPEFKALGSKIVLIETEILEDLTPNFEVLRKNLNSIKRFIDQKKIISAFALREGGIAEALCKMSFGNKVGANITWKKAYGELFKSGYGSFIVEIPSDLSLDFMESIDYEILGSTHGEETVIINETRLDIEELIKLWETPLEGVFPSKSKLEKTNSFEAKLFNGKSYSVFNKKAEPRVFIPVFPGTNCEYDSIKAFEKEGAKVSSLVFRNLTKETLKESLELMKKEISQCQIMMLPGGFSAGDEPEGSGKFIATVFRNPQLKEAVMELLKVRDGLVLGICNGFQALIKLGLVPYGEILDIEEPMATLTYNSIGRHVSSIVKTKISSKLSPWLMEAELGGVYDIPVSHGEGRVIASEDLIKKLVDNGQIATQYVDFEGKVAINMPYNPNGSAYGIEGITSPDGRIFGKMGHSERIGNNLYKNITGNFDQGLFKSGVKYFK